MTDPIPTPAAPTEPAATPPPAPEASTKGKSGRRIVATIVGVVVAVVVAVGIRALAGGLFHGTSIDDFKVGKCVDQYSTSATAQRTSVPNVVDCSGSSAKATIVGVFDGKAAGDAQTYCPSNADAYLQLDKSAGGTVLVCLEGK